MTTRECDVCDSGDHVESWLPLLSSASAQEKEKERRKERERERRGSCN